MNQWWRPNSVPYCNSIIGSLFNTLAIAQNPIWILWKQNLIFRNVRIIWKVIETTTIQIIQFIIDPMMVGFGKSGQQCRIYVNVPKMFRRFVIILNVKIIWIQFKVFRNLNISNGKSDSCEKWYNKKVFRILKENIFEIFKPTEYFKGQKTRDNVMCWIIALKNLKLNLKTINNMSLTPKLCHPPHVKWLKNYTENFTTK